jgi:hypothetical protein
MAFLERANGGEGFIGERYARLWRAEELIEVNRGYNVAEFFPNLFLIGTDGGGEAYAFNVSANDSTVFVVPFIGMPSDARAIANSFDSFVAALNIQTDQGQCIMKKRPASEGRGCDGRRLRSAALCRASLRYGGAGE